MKHQSTIKLSQEMMLQVVQQWLDSGVGGGKAPTVTTVSATPSLFCPPDAATFEVVTEIEED